MAEPRYHVPQEEQLDREALVALQRRKLADMLGRVLKSNAFYRARIGRIEFDPAADPMDRLPLTSRADLQLDQAAHPPFGTNLSCERSAYCRYHQTSGSRGEALRWLDTAESWDWWRRCWGIIYRGAGVSGADRLVFPFSFGPFIGFWAAFEGAVALGNLALAAGGMTTSARLRYIVDNGATIVCCTPTYALHMAEVAEADGVDLAGSDVRGLIVAGEPGGSVPATRGRIESAWGARVFDHSGMTEIGAVAFECEQAPGGLHVIESEFIAEVIDPATGRTVPDDGGILEGELVLTNLGRWPSPLIRYRTGDHVRLSRGHCSCGRHFARAEGGILGRIDDMIIIRGNNVFPATLEDIIRECGEVAEFRIRVDRSRPLVDLRIEVEPTPQADSATLERRLAKAVRDRCHFRPRIALVEPGSLPRFEMKARRLVADAPSCSAK